MRFPVFYTRQLIAFPTSSHDVGSSLRLYESMQREYFARCPVLSIVNSNICMLACTGSAVDGLPRIEYCHNHGCIGYGCSQSTSYGIPIKLECAPAARPDSCTMPCAACGIGVPCVATDTLSRWVRIPESAVPDIACSAWSSR